MDDQHDFVTRQYAGLIASGMNEDAARTRLREVLGDTALHFLGAHGEASHGDRSGHPGSAARLMEAATSLGGNAAEAHAAFAHATDEARLLALDWWRPIRTFLLYIAFLLALAVAIAILFTLYVLPTFSHLDATMAMPVQDGTAYWANDMLRLFAPLVAIVALLVVLAVLWFRMRQRMARLRPFAGLSRFPWLYGRSGTAYHALLCLEYASALKAGGVPDAAVLDPALRLANWPRDQPFQTRQNPLGKKLEQAQRLGTFAAELAWQRRLYWSHAQSHLELSRDRLTLFSRVIFYILIGYMVTVLYMPIFSIASLFGVHP